MAIKRLIPSLMERGKIKIGDKGKITTSGRGKQFEPPIKLDYFRITLTERDEVGRLIEDKELMAKLAPTNGGKLREIPIRLLYDSPDLNFNTWLAAYKGQTLWCIGDNEAAQRLDDTAKKRIQVPCPCDHVSPLYSGEMPCKYNGKLVCIIEGAERLGGVWTFRTTSYNSVISIMSSLELIRTAAGGFLSGIPLKLVVGPKRAVVPATGQVQTVFIVTIEFQGKEEELMAAAEKIALKRKTHLVRMDNLEAEARRLIELVPEKEDPEDVIQEFYPEVVEAELAKEKAAEKEKEATPKAVVVDLNGPARVVPPGPADPAVGAPPEETQAPAEIVVPPEETQAPAESRARNGVKLCEIPDCGKPAERRTEEGVFLCKGHFSAPKEAPADPVETISPPENEPETTLPPPGGEPETPQAEEGPAGNAAPFEVVKCGKCGFEYPDEPDGSGKTICPECKTPKGKLF